jgi:hypothetical protein
MKPTTSVSPTRKPHRLRSAFCLCLFLAVATTALAAPRQKVIFENATPNSEIGVTVDQDELVKRIMDRYLRQNLMRQP